MYDAFYSLGTEQLSKVVVIDAGPDKFLSGHPPVAIDIHPLEDVLSSLLRSLKLVNEGLNYYSRSMNIDIWSKTCCT